MRNRRLLILVLAVLAPLCANAQKASDFKTDSLAVLLKERTGVRSSVQLRKVLKRGRKLDLYFSNNLSNFPWRPEDVRWLRSTVSNLFPESWEGWALGEIFCERTDFSQLPVEELSFDGSPRPYRYPGKEKSGTRLVRRIGEPSCDKGLGNRHIALWQSHGNYFDDRRGEWVWQRPKMWRTVEDMYTQSYVLPLLIPMLERAGACVMTPRERDTQRDEVVADNDPSFLDVLAPEPDCTRPAEFAAGTSSPYPGEHCRRKGSFGQSGKWTPAGEGFADAKRWYHLHDNPFRMGTALKSSCVAASEGSSRTVWTAEFPTRGSYAVYVSYLTLPESSSCAHYRVEHLGGVSDFAVNQKMAGGTWVYLGTFEFEGRGLVTLDNGTPKGGKFVRGSVVTADAVRFGGGYGKVVRGMEDTPEEQMTSSGYPAYAEGALYSEIWYGADEKVYADWETEYVRDYASRGAWVKWLKDDKGVPFDLSLAFHTDAGLTPDDSIVGTLSIYTLMAEGRRRNSDGTDRMTGRLLSDRIQSQIVSDLRAGWNPSWTRRPMWNRSYSESRTTDVPGTLLELLSHQNFADMKYGLDPAFRFSVCRSVYKGMLKTLADLYDRQYVVQPLPVHAFSATISEDRAVLEWQSTEDPSEPTAKARSYIVYTRIDDGSFDDGVRVGTTSYEKKLKPGHIYSFKVEAENEGGRSFPSEILAAGIQESSETTEPVLIVNNFTRVSGPTWFDTPSYAGFSPEIDGGVPYLSDISYIGEVYCKRRTRPWDGAADPEFGNCTDEYAGKTVAGNSFDHVYEHGKALFSLGRSFCSQSAESFCNSQQYWSTIDLVCGKQVRTTLGKASYAVFPRQMRKALWSATSSGSNLIVSGANICTDAWDAIYPQCADSLHREEEMSFIREVLGIKFVSSFGARDGAVELPSGPALLYHEPNEEHYCVERCDEIAPARPSRSRAVAFYPQDKGTAGLLCEGSGYRTACFGFPLEALQKPSEMTLILQEVLNFFEND